MKAREILSDDTWLSIFIFMFSISIINIDIPNHRIIMNKYIEIIQYANYNGEGEMHKVGSV